MIILPYRGVLKVSGAERDSFLQNILSNDIRKSCSSSLLYALLLTPQGKILYDIFILSHQNYYLLDVPKKYIGEFVKKLHLYKLSSDVVIEIVESFNVALSHAASGFFSDPRSLKLCHRGFVARDNSANNSDDQLLELYHYSRIALKIPELGLDFQPLEYFPLDLGMAALNALDYNKGCYIGQEVVARTTYRGNTRKKIYKLCFESNAENLEPGAEVVCGDSVLGSLMRPYGSVSLAVLNIEKVDSCAVQQLEAKVGNKKVIVEY